MTASVYTAWHRTWAGERDDEGHRTFKVKHLVRVTDPKMDGPATVMFASGLPAIGSYWRFGNEFDTWAFCWPTMGLKIHEEKEGERGEFWEVDQQFSTKPIPSKRCQDTQIEDPLQEPMRLSGSFVKTTEEAVFDYFGNYIKSSSHERFRGSLVEFDVGRPTVRIEQNVLTLGLSSISAYLDCVNDRPLWGMPERCIKLSAISWSRELYGVCNYYYKRIFDFDVCSSTFDRAIPDVGTKVLNGHWDQATGQWFLDTVGGSPPDRNNPQHFCQYLDRNGNAGPVILNGSGLPAGAIVGTGSGDVTGPGYVWIVQKYPQVNFLGLGIPSSL